MYDAVSLSLPDLSTPSPYAGIGSRSAPADVLALMRRIAAALAHRGHVLRTGGAPGADSAFEAGARDARGLLGMYLPWRGFEQRTDRVILHEPTTQAYEFAPRFHPAWSGLRRGPRALIARNVHQVLGSTCDRPVRFVLCWTEDGATRAAETTARTGAVRAPRSDTRTHTVCRCGTCGARSIVPRGSGSRRSAVVSHILRPICVQRVDSQLRPYISHLRWRRGVAEEDATMSETIDTVAVFPHVIENMSEERARSYQAAMLLQHGCLFSRIEDRSADREGWACVTYFHPRTELYNYGRKDNVRVSKLPKGVMDIYRSYDSEVAA
jgi:hypothetical protein